MTNAFSLFRSLIVYGLCLPLAIFIGYLLATPTDVATFATVGMLLSLMTVPLFLRWHYPWLILAWNMIGGLYFLPGKPSLTLFMICISFGFSALAHIMNRNLKFISVPSVARPLIFIGLVILGTAKLTGGIGLNIFGSEAMGGKRYIYILSAIVGYFALTAQRIPENKANLYVNLYFLGATTAAVGNLFSIISPSLNFIFLIFPADIMGESANPNTSLITRFSGLSVASTSAVFLLLARFGIQGVLEARKYWRLLLLCLLVVCSLLGGFRSRAIELMLTFGILFYLEGLLRSRLLPIILLSGVLVLSVTLPFANKLPLSIQRSLTFLPLNLDMEAELNAKSSTDWRLEMWANILPQVPQYLLLGKGLIINAHDMDVLTGVAEGESSAIAALAGDYHSGPLSLIIPFGIPGVVAFVWFLIAGFRVLRRNYRYGNPQYLLINRFLLTYFIVRCVMFVAVVGSFYSDLIVFVGPVAFSIALNGGMLNPVVEHVVRPAARRFRVAATAAR